MAILLHSQFLKRWNTFTSTEPTPSSSPCLITILSVFRWNTVWVSGGLWNEIKCDKKKKNPSVCTECTDYLKHLATICVSVVCSFMISVSLTDTCASCFKRLILCTSGLMLRSEYWGICLHTSTSKSPWSHLSPTQPTGVNTSKYTN